MICMDPTVTTIVIKSLIDKYDADVLSWAVHIATVCKTMCMY